MKNFITLSILLAFGISLYAQNMIINDPNAQLRMITSFHSIDISDGIDLFLSQGNEEAMAVSASNDASRDAIRTVVENGVLRIWSHNDGKIWTSGNRRMRAYVSFKNIGHLKASGASDVVISGRLQASTLKIQLSGASDLKGNIEAEKLKLEQSGASDARLTGKITELEVSVSGASKLDAYGLEVETCSVDASGASDVKVTVTKALNANANGASSVRYHGKAVITNFKSSGASKIRS